MEAAAAAAAAVQDYRQVRDCGYSCVPVGAIRYKSSQVGRYHY